MLRDGYWLTAYVSISSVIAETKMQYGKSYLHTETDRGDATYFLLYNTSVLEEAIIKLGDYVGRRRDELDQSLLRKEKVGRTSIYVPAHDLVRRLAAVSRLEE